MARSVKYGKPNMAALHGRLGKRIVNQISKTPPNDMKKVAEEARKVENRIKKAWGSND